MVYARHHESIPSAHPSVARAAEVPSTQMSVEYLGTNYFEEFYSNETASNVSPEGFISWDVPGSAEMTALDDCFIEVRGSYVLNATTDAGNIAPFATGANGQWAPTNQTVAPAEMLSCAIFKNVTVDLNGVSIVTSEGSNQPFAQFANVIKNESYVDRICGQFDKGYILDSPNALLPNSGGATLYTNNVYQYGTLPTGQAGTTTSPSFIRVLNQGVIDRQNAFLANINNLDAYTIPYNTGSTRTFSITVRLADLGLRCGSKWLPPNIPIRVTAQRTTKQFMREGDPAQTTAVDLQFNLTSAKMMMHRYKLRSDTAQQLQMAWMERPLKIPWERVRTQVQIISSSLTNVNIINALAGPTPSSVYVMFMPASSINENSDGGMPSFRLGPTNQASYIQSAKLTVGGKTFPANSIQQYAATLNGRITAPDISEIYQMYRQTCNRNPFLTSGDFTNKQILCFQLGTRTDGWDVAETTSLSFEAQFSAAPFHDITGQPVNWACMLVSFTPSAIEFGNDGSVQVAQ